MNYWAAIYRFAAALLAALVAVGVVFLFLPKCNKLRELQRRKAQLEEETRGSEGQIESLRVKQERFSSDPAFVERTAREIGMVKPDEIVFKFTNGQVEASRSGFP